MCSILSVARSWCFVKYDRIQGCCWGTLESLYECLVPYLHLAEELFISCTHRPFPSSRPCWSTEKIPYHQFDRCVKRWFKERVLHLLAVFWSERCDFYLHFVCRHPMNRCIGRNNSSTNERFISCHIAPGWHAHPHIFVLHQFHSLIELHLIRKIRLYIITVYFSVQGSRGLSLRSFGQTFQTPGQLNSGFTNT